MANDSEVRTMEELLESIAKALWGIKSSLDELAFRPVAKEEEQNE